MHHVTSVTLSFLAIAQLTLICATAGETVFFNSAQVATNVASGSTSDTIGCRGYWFQQSMDKWWYPSISIGGGTPTGRSVRVHWPDGVEAQAVTAGPNGLQTNQSLSKARIILKRADSLPFDIRSFTMKLLANTAGAGGAFEVMPKLDGEDMLADPLSFNATGVAGNTFTYNHSALAGADTYDISLYVDFALTGLTVVDSAPEPPPVLSISNLPPDSIALSWPGTAAGFSLETSPDLLPGSFTAVPDAPEMIGDFYTVILPATNRVSCFRLVK